MFKKLITFLYYKFVIKNKLKEEILSNIEELFLFNVMRYDSSNVFMDNETVIVFYNTKGNYIQIGKSSIITVSEKQMTPELEINKLSDELEIALETENYEKAQEIKIQLDNLQKLSN